MAVIIHTRGTSDLPNFRYTDKIYRVRYDMIMIFINCKWVSTQRQWSMNLYKNRKETAIDKSRKDIQNNTKTQNTQNIKQTYKKTNIKRILKNVSGVIRE